MVLWYGCVFPLTGSVPFSPAFPVASLSILASGRIHIGSTAASSSTDDLTVPRSPFGSRFYLSDIADSVVVARGFAEARPHHSPGAAKSTGQATANKPFVQYHVYSGNKGSKMLISTVNFHSRSLLRRSLIMDDLESALISTEPSSIRLLRNSVLTK